MNNSIEKLNQIISSFIGRDGVKIGLIGGSFRAAKLIFEDIKDNFSSSETECWREIDCWKLKISNITIEALPWNEKIPNYKFDILIISDGHLAPEDSHSIINPMNVIKIYIPEFRR